MKKNDLVPAAVFMVGPHAFLALVVTLVAWEKGWPSASGGSWDDLEWWFSTILLGAPWSALAASGTAIAWDLLFVVSPWINVAIHAGLWAVALRIIRRARPPVVEEPRNP